jgi:predicted lipid-binding transport protein (Tim44 family)
MAQHARAETRASGIPMQDSFDMTTIVFALLAVFLVWKLRSLLGTRNGNEKPPRNPFLERVRGQAQPRDGDDAKVVTLPGVAEPASTAKVDPAQRWHGFAEPGSKAWAGLDRIAAADPSFAAASFIAGAKTAYELIITAFAAGNRDLLQTLLAKDVFDSFAAAIAERETRGDKVDTTFVSIDEATIADAELRGKTAEITVHFAAQIITATTDRNGAPIEGSTDKVVEIKDIWTFVRESGSRDPNWRLLATGTAD